MRNIAATSNVVRRWLSLATAVSVSSYGRAPTGWNRPEAVVPDPDDMLGHMVTEREIDDSKRLLDRISEEYETEFRGGRVRLARRAKKKRRVVDWRSMATVLIWVALVVAVGVLSIALERYDFAEFLSRMAAFTDSGR